MDTDIVVPDWAPPYDDVDLVRYYYIPDIEVFYDVWNQDFVYLEDGSWMFSPTLPPEYADFDLYDCFIVLLDSDVYEPWMHFHFYVSHYPRYYYRSLYNITDTSDFRGFDENERREIRITPEQRMRMEETFRNRPAPEMGRPPIEEERTPEFTREPQPMRYYGRDIGTPVPVQRQMKRPREKGQMMRPGREGQRRR